MRTFQSSALLSVLVGATACYSGVSLDPDDTGDAATDSGPAGGGNDDGDDDGGSSGDGGDSDDDGVASCAGAALTVSRAPMRRLTRAQYRNSVLDLLGHSAALEEALEPLGLLLDGKAGLFSVTTSAVDVEAARTYMVVSEDIASVALSEEVAALPQCDWADSACIESFVDSFGRRVFRRPLSDDERGRYLQLWTSQRAEQDATDALATLISALLASPHFLYLEEPANAATDGEMVVELEQYALASRLSYFLWQTTPDEALLDAAEGLGDSNTLEDQVERMMDDPRFDRTLASFHNELVEIDRLDTLQSDDPRWSESLREGMHAELAAFARHVFRDSEGTIDELLTASYTFATPELAALYGVEAPSGDLQRVDLDPARRSGLLTQSGFLTISGGLFAEVHRGKFIREALLCDTLPQPPEDLELDPNVVRLETAPCSGCHLYMDPIGNGFADYGPLGDDLGPSEMDASGEVIPLVPNGVEGTFEGAVELAHLLATSESVERCMSTQWSRYALGRLETEDDACAIEELGTATIESGGDLRSLVRTIALSPRFRVRRADAFSE